MKPDNYDDYLEIDLVELFYAIISPACKKKSDGSEMISGLISGSIAYICCSLYQYFRLHPGFLSLPVSVHTGFLSR